MLHFEETALESPRLLSHISYFTNAWPNFSIFDAQQNSLLGFVRFYAFVQCGPRLYELKPEQDIKSPDLLVRKAKFELTKTPTHLLPFGETALESPHLLTDISPFTNEPAKQPSSLSLSLCTWQELWRARTAPATWQTRRSRSRSGR